MIGIRRADVKAAAVNVAAGYIYIGPSANFSKSGSGL